MNKNLNLVQSNFSSMRKTLVNPVIEQINQNEPLNVSSDVELKNAFHYWQGASGKRYIHSVYSLFNCPEVPKVNYVLVRREGNGTCTALAIGETKESACSLNLAFLRHNAAKLHANEIHIHVMPQTKYERDMVRLDLLGCQSINGQKPKH